MDIGANEGQFITELSNIMEVEALCGEPRKDAYQRLKLNVSSLYGVEAVQLAIAETAGQQDFYEPESDVGSSLIRPIAVQRSSWARTVGTTRVTTARLYDVISDWGRTLDLLKADTQGTDLRVLRTPTAYLC
jgi:FkbM family methyltransferase